MAAKSGSKSTTAAIRSLFWRSPNFYPTSLVHTLSLMSYFAKLSQRVAREITEDPFKDSAARRKAESSGLVAFKVAREAYPGQALNFGMLHFTDKEASTPLLQQFESHRVPAPRLKRHTKFGKIENYDGLADLAPLLGIEDRLPESLKQRPKQSPSNLYTQSSTEPEHMDEFSQTLARPDESEEDQRPEMGWFEVKVTKLVSDQRKRRTFATEDERSVIHDFPGFSALIKKHNHELSVARQAAQQEAPKRPRERTLRCQKP